MKLRELYPYLKETDGAFILAEEYLHLKKGDFLLYPEREIDGSDIFFEKFSLLKSSVPVQYILGYWEFEGRRFEVGDGVLIPREDTLSVVSLGKKALKNGGVFLDLGSGSGCIAVTLSLDCGAKGYAVERSKKAYGYLERNIKAHCADVVPLLGDMFNLREADNLPPLDLIISNPPYITKDEMRNLDRVVLREPPDALYGGEDGLDYYRKIIPLYKKRLKKGGVMAFEVGFRQAEDVSALLSYYGFSQICESLDINNIKRAVSGVKTEE